MFSQELPSDGSRQIRCREYTVKDAITVSSMNPKMKEAFATRFLEVLQIGDDPVDPKTEMTVSDRRTILFHYALNFLETEKLNAPEEYSVRDCPLCGEKHVFHLSLLQLAEVLKNKVLKPGNDSLTADFAGTKLLFTPLKGEHAEHLEFLDQVMAGREAEHGLNSKEYQKVRVEKEVYRLLSQISLVEEDAKEDNPAKLKKKTEKWLNELRADQFEELRKLASAKQEKMAHGIDFTYSLRCPNFKGEDEKEGLVACRLPFRFEELVPRI